MSLTKCYNLELKTLYIHSLEGVPLEEPETGIDFRVASEVLKAIDLLEGKDGGRPLRVILMTHGGEEQAGLAIYDRLRECTCPLIIIGYGQVNSIGAWILQAATRIPEDLRLLASRAELMIHHGERSRKSRKSKSDRNYHSFLDKQDVFFTNALLEQVRKKHPKTTYEELFNLLKADTYFTAKEAVDFGLADDLVVEAE